MCMPFVVSTGVINHAPTNLMAMLAGTLVYAFLPVSSFSCHLRVILVMASPTPYVSHLHILGTSSRLVVVGLSLLYIAKLHLNFVPIQDYKPDTCCVPIGSCDS
jgi:hypothetical protein